MSSLRFLSTMAPGVVLFLMVACLSTQWAAAKPQADPVPLIVFNITVDETEWRPCVGWGLTPSLAPNETTPREVPIQSCDAGKFSYAYRYNFNYPVLQPVFHSQAILDASPPTCTITCKPTSDHAKPYHCSFCSVMDSREGYHLTKFKFDVVSWKWRS